MAGLFVRIRRQVHVHMLQTWMNLWWWKNFEDIFIRFGATPERDRQTDGHRVTAYTALMHMHLAVKTVGGVAIWKKTLTTHIHTYRHSSHRYYKLCWLQAAVRQKKQNRLQCNLLRTRTTTTTTANNKLSCRSETARRFLSLNILLSHSRSFKTTLLSRACVSTY